MSMIGMSVLAEEAMPEVAPAETVVVEEISVEEISDEETVDEEDLTEEVTESISDEEVSDEETSEEETTESISTEEISAEDISEGETTEEIAVEDTSEEETTERIAAEEIATEEISEEEASDEETSEEAVEESIEIIDEELGETANSGEAVCDENYLVEIVDGNATIVGYKGKDKDLVIPNQITYKGKKYTVTQIKDQAFENCKDLTAVVIPETCVGLGWNSFAGCTGLKKIVIPASVKTIEGSAFYGCTGLLEAEVKNSFVGADEFAGCVNLQQLTLNDNVTKIEKKAFIDCKKLRNIDLPNSLTTIGDYAFYGCLSLGTLSIPSSLKNVGYLAFYDCGLDLVTIDMETIPDEMFDSAHYLKKVVFTDNVKKIGANAFQHCDLQEIRLGNNVTEVGEGAFRYNMNCTSVYINDKCTKIGKATFEHLYQLQSVVIGKRITTIPENCFSNDFNLETVLLSDSVKTIEKNAFGTSTIFTINIPKSVTKIDKEAFSNGWVMNVVCAKGSTADNKTLYPDHTPNFVYSYEKLTKPTMTVKVACPGRSVTFTSNVKGAVIYYGNSPQITNANAFTFSGGAVQFPTYGENGNKIYAKAYYNGEWSDTAVIALTIPETQTPTASWANGKVTVQTATPDCDIYYTTDGSAPSLTNGFKIKGSKVSFDVSGGVTVRAIAARNGYSVSKEVSVKAKSNVSGTLQVPSFAVKGVFGGRNVTFNGPKGSKIYYSTSSSMSSKDKCVNAGETVLFEKFYGTIYARTYKDGKWSNTARLILRIPECSCCMFEKVGDNKLTITSGTPNCYIIYTTDDTLPSLTNGKRLSGSKGTINIEKGKRVRAMAVRSCFSNSIMTGWGE